MKGVGDGIGGGAPPGASNTPVGQKVEALVSKAVTEAARPAVAFAGAVVTLGAIISLLVPNIPAEHDPSPAGPGVEGGSWEYEPPTPPDPEAEPEVEPTPA